MSKAPYKEVINVICALGVRLVFRLWPMFADARGIKKALNVSTDFKSILKSSLYMPTPTNLSLIYRIQEPPSIIKNKGKS